MWCVTFLAPISAVASDDAFSPNSDAESEEKIELSLNSVIMFALDQDPDILISEARVEQARGVVKRAHAALYPTLDVETSLGREYNGPAAGEPGGDSGTNGTGGISFLAGQLLYDGGIAGSTIRQQTYAKSSAEVRSEAATENLITQAIVHYLSIYRLQNQVENSEGFIERVHKITNIVEDMFQAGAQGKVAVDYAKSRYSASKTDFNRLNASLNDAKSELEFLTGPLPGLVAVLPEDVNPDARVIDYYFDKAMKNNSALRVNRFELKSRKERLKAVKAEYLPVIDMTLEARHRWNDGGEIGVNQRLRALVNMRWSLFDGFERDGEKQLVMGQIDELKAVDDRITNELQRQVKQSYNQIKSLRESIKTTTEEIKSNKDLQGLNLQNFKLGNVNVIELIEGEERLNAARLRKYDLIGDLYFSAYELLVLAGVLDKENFCASC